MKSLKSFAIALLCLSGILLHAEEKEPTAFELVKEGNRYVGFMFARGDSPEAVEAALRTAHARLRFEIDAPVAALGD